MNYFLITSRGLTASTWLSKTLNDLPKVFVSHGRDYPKRSQEDLTVLLKDEEYRESRINYEWLNQRDSKIKDFLNSNINNNQLDHEINCIGNVHGYKLEEAISKIKYNSEKVDIIGNMIRSPFNFIGSYINMVYQNYMIFPEKFFAENIPRVEQNKQYLYFFKNHEYQLIDTIFIEACFACLSSAKDLNIKGFKQIKMEDLTTNRICLENFLDEICQKYSLDNNSINKVVNNNQLNKNVNTHQNAYKIFNYKSIKDQFNLDIRNFTKWPNNWKEFCIEFFDKDFKNYFQYYENDPLIKFYSLRK